MVGFALRLPLQLFNVLFKVFLSVRLGQSHHILLHPQLLQVLLDVVDGSLVIGRGRSLITIFVVTVVARVKYIVLQRVEMVGQRLDMMRPDEPLLGILLGQVVLHIFQVVVGRQVHFVGGRDVVVYELGTILDDTESLVRIVLLARVYINEVLLDVYLLFLSSKS